MAVGSFSAALSGLNANSAYLSVIGNNLANINTIGFKASTMTFADLVSQSLSGTSTNPMQVGLGVAPGAISQAFSQGSIENTREATNVALQGAGFFVVKGSSGNMYTRAGNFTLNKDGILSTPDGFFVQGYTAKDPATGAILTTGQPGNIVISPGVLQPTATSKFAAVSNLDANAAAASTFTASVQIYDSLGKAHVVTITYTKGAGAGAWTWAATVPGAEITGGTAGTPFQIAAGSLQFDGTGKLSSFTISAGGTGGGTPAADVTITTPTWTNGAAASVLTWDIVDANAVATLTGYASTSATSSITQNGTAPGTVESINITADGTIMATFGAGQTAAIGQLAIANFVNAKGMVKLGTNRYGESQAAGVPSIGVAGTGGRGTVLGSALEGSNVDIAQEFTQMILAQRGYQANAKSITVSDELLADTVNLKR
ncbi:MAG: flagellar hook protein FlgE [Acidobacteria bacterium]|nr:flagellar hook protein FlgE [Acidobacteriota bacterium]